MTLRCTKDARSDSRRDYVNSPLGNYAAMNAGAWTYDGDRGVNRAYLDFNWDSLPQGAEVQKAELLLFGFSKNGNPAHINSGENQFTIQRITANWQEATLTWNNKPNVTDASEVVINDPFTDKYQNYKVDVTDLVKIILQNQSSSFGFQIKVLNETPYRMLWFATKENAATELHPQLVITYKAPIVSDLITLAIDPSSYCAGDTVFVPFQTKVAFSSRNTFTAMISDANGSFDLPQVIGSLDQGSAIDEKITLIAVLPNDLVAGSQYRVRVTASLPQMVGSSSETKLTIKPSPTVPNITRNGKLLVSSASSGNQWYDENGIIPGAVDRSFLPARAGNYYVVTTQGGCSAKSNVFTYTGRNENAFTNSSIRVYPNPAREQVTIHSSPWVTEQIRLRLTDLSGRLVKEGSLDSEEGMLSLSGVSAGYYLLTFINAQGQHTVKLMVE